MKKIDNNLLKDIASKLMIELSDEEISILLNEINESINDLNSIKDLNVDNVNPTNFININVNNDFREDKVVEFKNKEKLLNNAKEKIKGYIKV